MNILTKQEEKNKKDPEEMYISQTRKIRLRQNIAVIVLTIIVGVITVMHGADGGILACVGFLVIRRILD